MNAPHDTIAKTNISWTFLFYYFTFNILLLLFIFFIFFNASLNFNNCNLIILNLNYSIVLSFIKNIYFGQFFFLGLSIWEKLFYILFANEKLFLIEYCKPMLPPKTKINKSLNGSEDIKFRDILAFAKNSRNSFVKEFITDSNDLRREHKECR